MSALEAVVGQFLDDVGDVVRNPVAVREQCAIVSAEFVDRCRAAGIEAEVIQGLHMGEHKMFPGETLVLAGHYAARVGTTVYDWTARQFDPSAPVPLIQDESAWRETWQDLGGAPTDRPPT